MPYSEIIPSGIEGSFILTPKTFGDDRGWYSPRTEVAELAEISGIDLHNFTQIAESFNAESGILRGLHYQLSPNEQGKLVRVIFGAVYDVALDLRL
ncbi:MAG TPA: dTDP-4-dehydrorhamnose 3,5-epimerase family protein, partial [Patescibacteria group bacterium]